MFDLSTFLTQLFSNLDWLGFFVGILKAFFGLPA